MKIEDKARELYKLLGHQVKETVTRSDTTLDIFIQSSKGEFWIARVEKSKQVSFAQVKVFLQTLNTQKAKQAAIITDGEFAPEVVTTLKGKPIHLLTEKTLDDYLNQARKLPTKRTEKESVEAGITNAKTTHPVQEEQFKACPYCAEEIPASSNICPLCEIDFSKPHVPTIRPIPTPKKSNPAVPLLVIVLTLQRRFALLRRFKGYTVWQSLNGGECHAFQKCTRQMP